MGGPAPNPNARRRNDKGAWRSLQPVCARPAPRWPFRRKALLGQAELWRALWVLPQAELWHEAGAVRLVARYAVLSLTAETALTHPTVLSEVRQLEDKLLLAPQSLIRARCVVADTPVVAAEAPAGVSNLDDYRDLGVS